MLTTCKIRNMRGTPTVVTNCSCTYIRVHQFMTISIDIHLNQWRITEEFITFVQLLTCTIALEVVKSTEQKRPPHNQRPGPPQTWHDGLWCTFACIILPCARTSKCRSTQNKTESSEEERPITARLLISEVKLECECSCTSQSYWTVHLQNSWATPQWIKECWIFHEEVSGSSIELTPLRLRLLVILKFLAVTIQYLSQVARSSITCSLERGDYMQRGRVEVDVFSFLLTLKERLTEGNCTPFQRC